MTGMMVLQKQQVLENRDIGMDGQNLPRRFSGDLEHIATQSNTSDHLLGIDLVQSYKHILGE